jgi:hypothetical protein
MNLQNFQKIDLLTLLEKWEELLHIPAEKTSQLKEKMKQFQYHPKVVESSVTLR